MPPDSGEGADGERRAPERSARYEITMMVVLVEVGMSHRMSRRGYHHPDPQSIRFPVTRLRQHPIPSVNLPVP
jgi:hypothetical protein